MVWEEGCERPRLGDGGKDVVGREGWGRAGWVSGSKGGQGGGPGGRASSETGVVSVIGTVGRDQRMRSRTRVRRLRERGDEVEGRRWGRRGVNALA